jgi:hypothetical protein
VFLLDARGDGQYLRATWHPNGRLFVLSHWQDDVCVAATRLDVADAGELVALLATGLTDAATTPVAPPAPPQPVTPSARARARSALRWLRSRAGLGGTASAPVPPEPGPEAFESTTIPWRAGLEAPRAAGGGRADR